MGGGKDFIKERTISIDQLVYQVLNLMEIQIKTIMKFHHRL
jgi:hypothetical protein